MNKDIVFAHPVTSYDSYTDYRELVRLGDFEVCNQDQIDTCRDALYICSPCNGDVEAALRARPKEGRKCKIAIWFLERPNLAEFRDWTLGILQMADYIWFSDRAMYNRVKDIDGTVFAPCGSDERLGTLEKGAFIYDYCHMSYVWGRRDFLHNIQGSMGPNGWGQARHEVLTQSRFMLNVHQNGDPFHEPLRYALCAAYGIPLVSEYNEDPFPYEPGVDIAQIEYHKIIPVFNKIIMEDYTKWRDMGMRMFEKATKTFRFSDNVKRTVAEME